MSDDTQEGHVWVECGEGFEPTAGRRYRFPRTIVIVGPVPYHTQNDCTVHNSGELAG